MAAATLKCREHPKLVFSSAGTCELRRAKPDKFPGCAACPGPLPISAPRLPGPPWPQTRLSRPAPPPSRDGLAGAPAEPNTEPCLICGKVTAFPRAWLRVHLDAQPTGLGTPRLLAGERWPLCSRECQAQAEDPKLTGAVIEAVADALGAQ